MGAILLRILSAVLQGVGVSLSVQAIVNTINGLLMGTSGAPSYAQLANTVVSINGDVENPTYGLNALEDLINSTTVEILAAISALTDGTTPVSLPPTPPSGYGGGDFSTIGGYVWSYTLASGNNAGDQQDNAGNFATNLATAGVGFTGVNSSWFQLSGTWWSDNGPDSPSSAPKWDPTTILSDDTLLTFLERESLYTGWDLDNDSHAQVRQDIAFNDYVYTSLMDTAQFIQYRDAIFSVVSASGAPVWPGVDLVTFGTTQSISDGASISEDMSGVIVNLTSVPPGTSFFDFNGNPSWRYLGAICFVDDYGSFEMPQNLGFNQMVYACKSMHKATGVVMRVKDGVTGTFTTWI